MKILIAGCGYLGKALGKDLAASGAAVWGLRRDPLALKALEMVGIKPVQADLTKPESLTRLPEVDHVVLCQAPSKSTDNYHAAYYEATQNLIEASHFKKPKKLIMISSTGVYGAAEGAWVDEETSTDDVGYLSKEAEARARTLLKTEDLVLSGLIPALVFRLGGIYGPKRNRLKAIKEGKMRPSFSNLYSNRIHVDDAVSGIKLLMEKGKPGEIYLGVDDEPTTENQFYSWIYEKLSLAKPSDSEKANENDRASNKRCSNKKIKQLGMKFRYPTFREGYSGLLAEIGIYR